MKVKALEEFLHQQIPLTRALGVRVVAADADHAEIFAALEPNKNHMGTAFGGSLSAMLILAGYTWLYHFLELEGHSTHVILKSCDVDYLWPVEEDLTVTCQRPSKTEVQKFLDGFKRRGFARIALKAEISTAQGKAAVLKGEFVAKKADKGQLG